VREEDAEFGIMALEKGLIDQQVLDECLAALSSGGKTLPDLIRQRGLLSEPQIEELRSEALRRVQSRQVLPSEAAVEAPPAAGPGPAAVPAPPAVAAETLPPEVVAAMADSSRKFGQFFLVRPVGRGSASEVWKAWDVTGNRWVALKLLREPPEVAARLMEGIGPAMGLKYPGIVTVYAAGTPPPSEGERSFIAMEFVEGATLDRLREEGMPIQKALEIVRDAALAVAYAHECRVIHRDLKPRNIMVDKEGHVRVMDFGLARTAGTFGPSDDVLLSRQIHVHGTPSYMSPEQALERTHDIGERSDVYSLGATLYFLVTGRPPFDAGNPMKTCFAVVREPLVPPSQHNPEVTADLERVIQRAMDKDPVQRYESAKALAEDLDRILRGAHVISDDQMRFTQGLAALHAGRLEEAVHMFKELIRIDAAGPAAGTGHLLGQLNEGEQGLSLAIGRQTKNYDIRTQRGVYRFARAIIRSLDGNDPSADCKSAMEDFLVAAQLRPEHTPARVNRANVLIFGGRYARDSGKDVSVIFEMALKDLDSAIEFDSTCSHAYHLRGIVHFYIARALKKGAEDPEPHYRQAINDFSRAAELEPTYGYLFKDLGVVKVALAKHLLSAGQKVKSLFQEAVSHLDMAVKLNKNLSGAYYERGQALFALKEFKAAVEDFNRCAGLDPSRDRKVQALIDEAKKHIERRQ
jgi:tetratricopeptide (TPR) repeat protein